MEVDTIVRRVMRGEFGVGCVGAGVVWTGVVMVAVIGHIHCLHLSEALPLLQHLQIIVIVDMYYC